MPGGVPALWLPPPLPLLPPQEAIQIVEQPRTSMRLRKRTPRIVRLRELKVKTIPIKPGSNIA